MMRRVAANVDPDPPLDEQVDAAVDGYIDNVTEQPALYASFVRELPGLGQAGARALGRHPRALRADAGHARRRGRAAQPELGVRPLTMDTAIIIVGGLRELPVISVQRGRDLQELRASVGATVKAILTGTLL